MVSGRIGEVLSRTKFIEVVIDTEIGTRYPDHSISVEESTHEEYFLLNCFGSSG